MIRINDGRQGLGFFRTHVIDRGGFISSFPHSQGRMAEARDLFRDQRRTEFVIVTIPTIMAVAESIRLASALVHEGVPLRTIVINQASAGEV